MFSAPAQAASLLAARSRRGGTSAARMRNALDAEAWDAILALVARHGRPFDNVRTRSEWASNPLQLAAARGNQPIVEALLNVGADVRLLLRRPMAPPPAPPPCLRVRCAPGSDSSCRTI
jgi:hypothetical protein